MRCEKRVDVVAVDRRATRVAPISVDWIGPPEVTPVDLILAVVAIGLLTALPFEVVFRSTGRSRLVRATSRAYHALARLWPGMFAYQVILEAEIITLDEESIWS